MTCGVDLAASACPFCRLSLPEHQQSLLNELRRGKDGRRLNAFKCFQGDYRERERCAEAPINDGDVC